MLVMFNPIQSHDRATQCHSQQDDGLDQRLSHGVHGIELSGIIGRICNGMQCTRPRDIRVQDVGKRVRRSTLALEDDLKPKYIRRYPNFHHKLMNYMRYPPYHQR